MCPSDTFLVLIYNCNIKIDVMFQQIRVRVYRVLSYVLAFKSNLNLDIISDILLNQSFPILFYYKTFIANSNIFNNGQGTQEKNTDSSIENFAS